VQAAVGEAADRRLGTLQAEPGIAVLGAGRIGMALDLDGDVLPRGRAVAPEARESDFQGIQLGELVGLQPRRVHREPQHLALDLVLLLQRVA
jgi:hypothetical protein